MAEVNLNPLTSFLVDPGVMEAYRKAAQEIEAESVGNNHLSFKIYRAVDINNGRNHLSFYINPSESQWSIPTRTLTEKVPGGAVHHEWATVGGIGSGVTRFDQPIIRFSFQAGNITPYAHQGDDFSNDLDEKLPEGLGNYYDFLSILNQPNMLNDGSENRVHIEYHSAIFPDITLKGFFTPEGVNWTDSSDNPYTISSWGASFEVFDSFPQLNGLALSNYFMGVGFSVIPNTFTGAEQSLFVVR